MVSSTKIMIIITVVVQRFYWDLLFLLLLSQDVDKIISSKQFTHLGIGKGKPANYFLLLFLLVIISWFYLDEKNNSSTNLWNVTLEVHFPFPIPFLSWCCTYLFTINCQDWITFWCWNGKGTRKMNVDIIMLMIIKE